MKIAISGTRNISLEDHRAIESSISGIMKPGLTEIFFGGARGADTAALEAAHKLRRPDANPKLTVIVPRKLGDQPRVATKAVERCADSVIELGANLLTGEAYRARNAALIKDADLLLAFWDGKSRGTKMTIDLANKKGIAISIVQL